MSIRHFSLSIATANRTLVQIDDYPVHENHITFLFGESGIGKSVISKALYGLMDDDSLNVTINNAPYGYHLNSEWAKSIRENSFFVFQEPSSHLNPLMKINEQLNEGSLDSRGDNDILEYLWQHSQENTLQTILNVYPKPYRPSGGEKQRILLAMAFKKINSIIENKPEHGSTYFVFDEPTGSLDNNYRNLFLNLLFQKYYAHPFTAVIITHDYSIISEVLRNYKKLLPAVHFKELSRIDESKVKVENFSPEEYINWLNKSHWHNSISQQNKPEPVLYVYPQFEIFSRKLNIYSNGIQPRLAPLTINRGEVIYLKAPSGIGKTTLAKIIMGIYKAERFSMKLCGVEYTHESHESRWIKEIWGKKAGMIFQHADESLNMESTVEEAFKGLKINKSIASVLSTLFEYYNEPAFLKKKIAFLSGGQKQRLNILRSLALEPDLIILDEPLNGLDFINVQKVLTLLNDLRMNGAALLMISHNEEIFDTIIPKENIYFLAAE
jgi:energy-coupling factor transport system ATP-binding protein